MLPGEIYEFITEFSGRIAKMEESALATGLEEHISAAEIRIVDKIGPGGSAKMSYVAKALEVTMSTLTVACDKLEQKDIIVRKRDKTDKRTVCVSLTSKGLIIYQYHKAFHENLIEMMFRGLSETDKKLLTSGIKNMSDYLEKHN